VTLGTKDHSRQTESTYTCKNGPTQSGGTAGSPGDDDDPPEERPVKLKKTYVCYFCYFCHNNSCWI